MFKKNIYEYKKFQFYSRTCCQFLEPVRFVCTLHQSSVYQRPTHHTPQQIHRCGRVGSSAHTTAGTNRCTNTRRSNPSERFIHSALIPTEMSFIIGNKELPDRNKKKKKTFVKFICL